MIQMIQSFYFITLFALTCTTIASASDSLTQKDFNALSLKQQNQYVSLHVADFIPLEKLNVNSLDIQAFAKKIADDVTSSSGVWGDTILEGDSLQLSFAKAESLQVLLGSDGSPIAYSGTAKAQGASTDDDVNCFFIEETETFTQSCYDQNKSIFEKFYYNLSGEDLEVDSGGPQIAAN